MEMIFLLHSKLATDTQNARLGSHLGSLVPERQGHSGARLVRYHKGAAFDLCEKGERVGTIQPGEKKAPERSYHLYKHLMGRNEGDRARTFSVPTARTKVYEYKTTTKKFHPSREYAWIWS